MKCFKWIKYYFKITYMCLCFTTNNWGNNVYSMVFQWGYLKHYFSIELPLNSEVILLVKLICISIHFQWSFNRVSMYFQWVFTGNWKITGFLWYAFNSTSDVPDLRTGKPMVFQCSEKQWKFNGISMEFFSVRELRKPMPSNILNSLNHSW